MPEDTYNERQELHTNSNYTKATAYLSAFLIVLVILVIWGALMFLGDAKAAVSSNTETNAQQDITLVDYGHRIVRVEEGRQRTDAEVAAIKKELLETIKNMQGDMRAVRQYVIEQQAKEAERDRLERFGGK